MADPSRHDRRARLLAVGLVLLSILGMILPTLGGYVWGSHETIPIVIRLQQMLEVWRLGGDWQVPWLPDVAHGHGMPFFTFYGAFGYYIAALAVVLTGCTIGTSVKFSFYLSLLVGAAGVYGAISSLLAQGASRVPAGGPAASDPALAAPLSPGRRAMWAAAGAIAFTTAPYHYTDIFVRASLGESWAFALMPCVVWAMESMRTAAAPWALGLRAWLLAALVAALMISHNITALYGVLFIAAWALGTASWTRDGLRWVVTIGLAGCLGMLLSAWFWVPAMTLKSTVRVGLVDVMFGTPQMLRAHGLYPVQFFLEQWGPGVSRGDATDTMAVNPGLLTMVGLTFGAAALALGRFAGLARRQMTVLLLLAATTILLSLAVMPWELLPELLRYIQFPWRLMLFLILLGTVALGVAGPCVLGPRFHPMLLVLPFALFSAWIGPLNALTAPEHASDADALAYYWQRYEIQDKQGFYAGCVVLEYAPRSIPMDYITPQHQRDHPAPENRILENRGAALLDYARDGLTRRYTYRAEGEAWLELALFGFPGWDLTLDGAPAPERVEASERGLLALRLPAGEHSFTLRYGLPPIAVQMRLLSGAGLALWALAGALCLGFTIRARRRRA